MSEIAGASGITREPLYKALRPDSQPRFDTVSRVCAALGVKLVVQAVHSQILPRGARRQGGIASPRWCVGAVEPPHLPRSPVMPARTVDSAAAFG